MNKTEKIMLGLAAAVALVLSAGVAFGMAAPQQYNKTGYSGGMMGGGGYSGGMMRGSYSGGMMGGSANSNAMMGGIGGMMHLMAQQMQGLWNQTWRSTPSSPSTFVAAVGYTFSPVSLTITRGTTVTWVNMDFVPHTVTSGNEGAATGFFDSHELSHMQSFSYTFNTPGTYPYYCDIHPDMIGSVIVIG